MSRFFEKGRSIVEIIAILVLMMLIILGGMWGFKTAFSSSKVRQITEDISIAVTERRYQIAQSGTSQKKSSTRTVGSTKMTIENVTSGADKGSFTILLSSQNKKICEEMKNYAVFVPKKIEINDSTENECVEINSLKFYFDGGNRGNGGNGGHSGGDDDNGGGNGDDSLKSKCDGKHCPTCQKCDGMTGKCINEPDTLTIGDCGKCHNGHPEKNDAVNIPVCQECGFDTNWKIANRKKGATITECQKCDGNGGIENKTEILDICYQCVDGEKEARTDTFTCGDTYCETGSVCVAGKCEKCPEGKKPMNGVCVECDTTNICPTCPIETPYWNDGKCVKCQNDICTCASYRDCDDGYFCDMTQSAKESQICSSSPRNGICREANTKTVGGNNYYSYQGKTSVSPQGAMDWWTAMDFCAAIGKNGVSMDERCSNSESTSIKTNRWGTCANWRLDSDGADYWTTDIWKNDSCYAFDITFSAADIYMGNGGTPGMSGYTRNYSYDRDSNRYALCQKTNIECFESDKIYPIELNANGCCIENTAKDKICPKNQKECISTCKGTCTNEICCPTQTPYWDGINCIKCPPIENCQSYNEDCSCADCTENFGRIFDGTTCRKICSVNSDCPSGKFCAFEKPNYFSDAGIGWCEDINEFIPKTFYNFSEKCWVKSTYPMTWWSAKNWCSAQRMSTAKTNTPTQVSTQLGGTEVWLEEGYDSIRSYFMADNVISYHAGKSDGFLALCYHTDTCSVTEDNSLVACSVNSDCSKDEFCAFQNGHALSNQQGPGYCHKISDFITYDFNVDGKEYLLSGAQMSSWSVSNWCAAQNKNRIQALPSTNVLNKLKTEFVGGSVWLTGRCLFFINNGTTNCTAVSADSFYAMCE